MAFTILQGQTDPPYQPELLDDTGAAFNFTGYLSSALTIKFELTSAQQPTVKNGTGTWTLVSGQAYYQWSVADVNQTGEWQIFVYVTTLTGTIRKWSDM